MSEQPIVLDDNDQPVEGPFLTIPQLAEYLGVKTSRIYAWRKRRVGPPSYEPKGVNLILYRKVDVEAWVIENLPEKDAEAEAPSNG